MLITLDAETFYSPQFSLSKLTTEAYIRSPEFEVIGMAIKIDDGPTRWYPQPQVKAALAAIDWSQAFLLAQNCSFDAAILAWHYDIRPKALFDTLGMSRALFPHDKSHSLAAQAQRAEIGVKGDEVLHALGKRFKDFDAESLARYGRYCCNDVELTYTLFKRYTDMGFPVQELKLIDLTLRMFTEPLLRLDSDLLVEHLREVRERKAALLERVADTLGTEASVEELKKSLMSNPKFAELLRFYGVEPPMKTSPATGKETYAFAKSDEEFLALQEHPIMEVQALVAARLGTKSTIEETRTERFLEMSGRGAFPVPLRYYGAHSSRWSAEGGINLQNLPSRGKDGGKLKNAILAPEGHVIIESDSAQIEVRVLAWLAGQDDLIEAFRKKEDVYRLMASKIYGKPPEEISKAERQVGKTVVLGCIAEGQLVLTDCGLVPIEQVTTCMRVWDGVEWVTHDGPIYQGEQEVFEYDSLAATPDHIVYLYDGTSCRFDEAAAKNIGIARTGDGRIPLQYDGDRIEGSIETPQRKTSQDVCSMYLLRGGEVDQHNQRKTRADARVSTVQSAEDATELVGETHKRHEATVYESPPCSMEGLRGTRDSVQIRVRSRGRSLDHSTHGATTGQRTGPNSDERALRAGESGLVDTNREYVAYATDSVHSTAVSISNDVSRSAVRGPYTTSIDGNFDRQRDCAAVRPAIVQTKRRVWDILNAGPRHRFTVSGRLVSNCGYGAGAPKLQAFLKVQAGVEVDDSEAKRIVDTYRRVNHKIVDLWKKADTALTYLAAGMTYIIDVHGTCIVAPRRGITLPNKLHIQYPGLRQVASESGKAQWVYDSKGEIIYIYGAKAVENLTQGVARCIVAEQMLQISKRYPVVLAVHDSAACIAPKAEAEEAQRFVEECMSWTPAWAKGLPLACESGVGESYGAC